MGRMAQPPPLLASRGLVLVALLVALAAGALGSSCAPAPACPVASSAPMGSTKPPLPQPPAIVQTGAQGLRARSKEVSPEQIKSAEMQDLVKTMISTMRAAPGVGLAAPQIGVPLRVIVLEDREELIKSLTADERRERERAPFPTRVFFNPVLKPVGEERVMFFEGCLSVKGYVGLVERSLEVEVSGLDGNGEPQTWRVRGWPARILQHELDHLDGTLYIDRMKTRSFATIDHAKALYAGKPIAEIRRMLDL